MFKVGDKVVYIGNHFRFTPGKVYTIETENNISIFVRCDTGKLCFFYLPDIGEYALMYDFVKNFTTIKEYRRKKLERINGQY